MLYEATLKAHVKHQGNHTTLKKNYTEYTKGVWSQLQIHKVLEINKCK